MEKKVWARFIGNGHCSGVSTKPDGETWYKSNGFYPVKATAALDPFRTGDYTVSQRTINGHPVSFGDWKQAAGL